MLEENYTECLNQLLQTCPCKLVIPSELKEALSRQGQAATIQRDNRRFVRHRRTERAVLECDQSLAAIPRKRSVARVITRDISRGGIAFLHAEQLFPGEIFTLWLSYGKLQFSAVRCRAHGEHCYEIGAETANGEVIAL